MHRATELMMTPLLFIILTKICYYITLEYSPSPSRKEMRMSWDHKLKIKGSYLALHTSWQVVYFVRAPFIFSTPLSLGPLSEICLLGKAREIEFPNVNTFSHPEQWKSHQTSFCLKYFNWQHISKLWRQELSFNLHICDVPNIIPNVHTGKAINL